MTATVTSASKTRVAARRMKLELTRKVFLRAGQERPRDARLNA
jgi:hypothetical protein